MLSRPFLVKNKLIVKEVFGGKDWSYFWQARFLPRWIPLLLGLSLGFIEASLIVNEQWHLALPLALAIPVVVLFINYPFVAVMIWLLVLPYFLNEPTAAGRFIYWIIHRAVIPTSLTIVILSNWLNIRKQRQSVKLGWAELAMLVFLGLLVTNIFLLNRDPTKAIIHAYDHIFIPFCMYWLIRLTGVSPTDLKRFLWIAFITVIAQAVIGILTWFTPEILPTKWVSLAGERTVGSLRNVAVYTSTLLFCALLLFQYAVNLAGKKLRFGLYITFGLALYCIFMSFSRGSWLGEIITLLALTSVYPKVILRFLIIFAVTVYILSGTILADQVAWGYERLTGEAAEDSALSRVTANDASIQMIEAKPFLGWGYGNYDEAKQPFMRRVAGVRVYMATSHNTFLSILAELGVISGFLYYFPAFWWLINSLKVWRQFAHSGFWSRPLLIMLWLVILHMLIVSSFMDMVRFHAFGTTIWWTVLALIANMVCNRLDSYKNKTRQSIHLLKPA